MWRVRPLGTTYKPTDLPINKSLIPVPPLCRYAMAQDTRVLIVESDERLGQFLTDSVEQFVGSPTANVSVREVDPNTFPDGYFDVSNANGLDH